MLYIQAAASITGSIITPILINLPFFSVAVAVGTPGGILSALLLFCLATPFLILGYYFWSVVRAAYLEIQNHASKNNPILPTIFQNGGKKYQRM